MKPSAQASLTRLEDIVGAAHVSSDPAELALRQADDVVPSVVIRPADSAQVAEIVRFAAAEGFSLIPCGGCTKLGIGSRASRYDIALDVSRMNRVLAYDPRDLTLGVEPGSRISDLLRVLSEERQFLPLAIPFFDRATIGGIVAANSTSPLRHAYGGVRDFCLGMEFITGDGMQAKSGGRVVKNVTGYDLHKLLIGSLGTLAVITRVNFRTFPLPPAQGTFVASFSDAESAFGFGRAIAHSVLTPQIVEIADPGAGHFLISHETPSRITPSQWSVIITAAGQPSVVDRHARELGQLATIADADEFVPLNDSEHSSILKRLSEFPRLVLDMSPEAAIFRIGALPTAMPSMLTKLSELAAKNKLRFAAITQASGIVSAALFPEEGSEKLTSAMAVAVREVFQFCAAPEINASAMLEWCPADVKRSVGSVWGPGRQDFALMHQLKRVFDPQNVLGPGRFASEG